MDSLLERLKRIEENQKAIKERLSKQLVHERVLYGHAGHTPLEYSATNSRGLTVLNLFGGAMPQPQAHSTRKYKLYAIYVDNMTDKGETSINISFKDYVANVTDINLTLPLTGWPHWHPRDSFTDWFSKPQNATHADISVALKDAPSDRWGVLFYLTIHAWDIFGN
jgi:hypothetical protein